MLPKCPISSQLFQILIISFCTLFFPSVQANAFENAYTGVNIGIGASWDTNEYNGEVANRIHISKDINPTNVTYDLYIGKRGNVFGMEVGYTVLPTYNSYVTAINPDRQIYQVIEGNGPFIRGVAFSPSVYGVSGYASLGVAYIMAKNHEYGQREGKPDDFKSESNAPSLILSVGLESNLKQGKVRLEASYLDSAVNMWWTGDRDYLRLTLSAYKAF